MARKTDNLIPILHALDHNEINQAALDKLDQLLERATLNLISNLTQITRPTLYRWLDESLPLDAMNVRDAAWFVVMCETSPKLQMLFERGPLSNPRLAKRLTDEVENREVTTDA